ncbi:MAG: cobalamin biosynthesis protein CobD [Candidatus Omnitrophica bacterium]|nr:cobalamin biosynthesis protein CobD [Candidatus Omnitrophota bacterium]
MLALALILGYALDLVLGDPPYRFHPVRLVGAMAKLYEDRIRRRVQDDVKAGWLLAIALPLDVFLITVGLLWLSNLAHPAMAFALSIFLIYSAISVRDMDDHVRRVDESLGRGDLASARQHLAKIVGRDTGTMEEKDIVRAAVETVAEGSLDGIVSPIFYAALGGAPFVMVFKTASTLDSLFGYRNERYENFGRFSARLDDLMNFIPARITPFLIALAAFFSGSDAARALRVGFRDGRNHPSPNSGFPESSFAGALGIRLGGLSYYEGQAVKKPFLHTEGREPEREDIAKSVRLMYFTSFFALLFSLVALLGAGMIFNHLTRYGGLE